MYNLILDDDNRPLKKLMECKYTTDGKYIIYDGRAYSTSTGEEIPINEGWSLSDILHTGADVLSMGLDFVIPGSGAVVDVLNAVSYVIEAEFKGGEEKDSLYLMALITFAFVIIPGPLQAIAVPLKRAVKTGVGMASKVVVKGLKIIGGVLDKLLVKLPATIKEALKSPLAKNIVGKWSEKISGFIDNFTNRVKQILNKLTGKEASEKAGKEAIEELSGEQFQKRFTIRDYICESIKYCDTGKIISNLKTKFPGPNIKFDPSNVKVLSKSNVAGREIMETQLGNGQKVLFYKSSGANQATTGKVAGEWFVLPGIAESGWFVKTTESVAFTKGGNEYLTEMAKFLMKNGPESLGKGVGKTASEAAAKTTLNRTSKNLLNNFINKLPKITKGQFLLKKLGFAIGKQYRYFNKLGKATTVTIKEITNRGVKLLFKDKTTTTVPFETFIKGTVGTPWIRSGYGVTIPFFIKRLSDVILSDGDIDYEKLESLPDLDNKTTSQESLNYSKEEVTGNNGSIGKKNVNNKVSIFQRALKMLGYDIGNYGQNKDGVDGKFGPKTQEALKKFQTDNGIKNPIGKMDKVTAMKLSDVLGEKNIQNSEKIKKSLRLI